MKLNYRSYPHPVVGNEDDVLDTAFQAVVEVQNDGAAYYLDVNVQTSSDTIKRLIKRGDAVYVLHVECSNTLYRRAFEFSEGAKTVVIPGGELNATVEVNVVARAKKDINRYRVNSSHPDYGRAAFAIGIGDILAVAEGFTFDADINFDSLRSVSSIMQIKARAEAADLPMSVELYDEKITVYLSKQDYKSYRLIRAHPNLSASVTSTLVLPALVEALTCVQNDRADYEEYRWCRCLIRRIEDLSLSLELEPLELAQRLLELPIQRALVLARAMIESDE